MIELVVRKCVIAEFYYWVVVATPSVAPGFYLFMLVFIWKYSNFTYVFYIKSCQCLMSRQLTNNGDCFFLQSTLRISPPLPYLASNMQKDLLRLGSRLDPQDTSSPLTPPPSASPASSALSRRWRSGSPWPGADMLDQSDTFSIEREARLHRQAAGTLKKRLYIS